MTKFKKSTIAKCVLATLAVGGVITIAAIAPNSLQMLKMFGVDKKRYKSELEKHFTEEELSEEVVTESEEVFDTEEIV